MSKRKPLPSQEYLKSILYYDEESGLLTWKSRPLEHFKELRSCNSWNSQKANKIAGGERTTPSGYTYKRVVIDQVVYRYHRVIWKMVYGEEVNLLDHIDGDATNNRVNNLRASSHSLNGKNTRLHKHNKSGIMGVNFLTDSGMWQVRIKNMQETIHLATCADFFEACCIRKSAENLYGFSHRHGRENPWLKAVCNLDTTSEVLKCQ